jgi:hypothetical protein
MKYVVSCSASMQHKSRQLKPGTAHPLLKGPVGYFHSPSGLVRLCIWLSTSLS